MSDRQSLFSIELDDGSTVTVDRVSSRRAPRSNVSTYHIEVEAPEGVILSASISDDAARAIAQGIVQVLA